jgi:hypothetical protein
MDLQRRECMKLRTFFPYSLVLISILLLAALQSASTQSADVAAERKITVLNPAASNTMVERIPLSARLGSLENKVIYMVDIGWGGPEAGYDVLQVISKWFANNMPTIKTVVVRKKGSYGTDDPALWKEIKAKGQAAILGLSC